MKLNILMLTYNILPEFGGGTTMYYELARHLAEAGHNVTVVTNVPQKGDGKDEEQIPLSEETRDGIHFIPVKLRRTKNSLIQRQLSNIVTDSLLVRRGLRVKSVDIIFMASPPITLPLFATVIKKLRKASMVLYLQDIFPEFLVSMDVLKRTNPLFKMARALEKWAYKGVDYISVHSPKNRLYVISRGVKPEKVHVMPLWVNTDFIGATPKTNTFSNENHLDHKFVVLYAGNVGMAMGAKTIPQAAKLLENEKDIQLIVVGSGSRYSEMVEETKRLDTRNLLLFPPRSLKELPEVLASSDVLLVMLRKELSDNPNGYFYAVIPHKLLSNMASGKPILLSAERDSDAARLVRIANCGMTVNPEDPEELARAIVEMRSNSKHLKNWGQNGINFAKTHFDSSIQVARIEDLFIHLKTHTTYEFNDPWSEDS